MHLYDLNQSVLINITRNINKFLLISLFSVFYFGSNLYAVCTDLGSGVISCDDTVNASVYELYAENSSYDINTITNNARGVYNDNNGSWILNSLNITSSGTDSHALSALNANITVGNNININTTNDRSKGILSEENSTVNVGSNINIYTDGQDSIGIHAAGTGSDYAVQYSRAAVNVGDNVTIRTKGSDIYPTQSRSDGISAKYGDITIGNNVDVLTTGIGSYGIRADYASTMVIGDNLSVVTTGQHGQQSTQYSGWWSYGIVSIKGSDIVIGDNLVVDVKGNNTLAVEAQTYWATRGFGVSKITIGDNARISTAGNETSVGLWASSGGQINIGDNAYIITTGGMGKGPTSAVQASDRYESMVNGEWLRPIINMGNNATIITTGIYSHGVYSYYGNITIGDNAKIITTNSSSNGVYSWGSASTNNIASSYGGSNVAIGDNSSVSVASSAIALYARQNGNITMGDNAVVNVNGSGSTAIGVHNYSTGVPVKLNLASNITFTGKATVNVDGSGSKVFSIGYDNGSVYFNDEAAINTFNESNDIFAVNTANKYNSNIHFNDALTINAYGNNSKAIYLDNGYTYDFNELDVNVYGANSYALYVGADSNFTLDEKASLRAFDNSSYAIYSNNGTVNSDISNTIDIYGNLFSDNDGAISLAFNNASSFAGAASLTERGVIYLSFDNSKWSVSGNSTISNLELLNGAAVDLNSSSDFIALHTDNILGDTGEFGIKVDAVNSLSDKVIINNSSTGVYNVKFDDRTTGGYVSNGSLSLSIIEYANHSNGNYNASFNGQVELGALVYTLTYDNQSEIYYIGDAAFGGSNNSGGGNGTTPTPQQSSSANTSVGFAMVNYAINNINTQTILQRMGELRQSNEQRDIMGDMWIRTYAGKLGSFDDNKRLDGVKYYGLQMGIDKMTNINNAKVYTGFSAGYARADANYEKGDSQTTLYDFGVYALYYDESDFYVDTLAKYTKNKNNFNAVTINNNSVSGDGDSNSVSLSAEVGKRYGLTNNIYLEPQVELSYTNQGSLSIKSSNGLKTEIDKYNSYLLRGSIIAGYKLKDTVNLYLKTGFIRELDGKSSYMFNADENSKKEYKPNKNTFDNALGITINSSAHNIYAEGAYQKGDEFDNVRANVGYRYRF